MHNLRNMLYGHDAQLELLALKLYFQEEQTVPMKALIVRMPNSSQ